MKGLMRWKEALVISALLLLVIGLRIFEGIHFVATIPQGDDMRILWLLQSLTQGHFDWTLFWARPNGHFFVLYYLINIVQYMFNGYWDPRLDFLTYAVIHAIEAGVVLFTFRHVLIQQDRWWFYIVLFFLFATPFGGYRIAWGNLYTYTNVVIFALPLLYGIVYGRGAGVSRRYWWLSRRSTPSTLAPVA